MHRTASRKTRYRILLTSLFVLALGHLAAFGTESVVSKPDPPPVLKNPDSTKIWILDERFSDEFNTTIVDETKWEKDLRPWGERRKLGFMWCGGCRAAHITVNSQWRTANFSASTRGNGNRPTNSIRRIRIASPGSAMSTMVVMACSLLCEVLARPAFACVSRRRIGLI